MRKKHLIVDLVIYLLIILFVYAAVSKLSDYPKFQVQLGQSPLLTAYAGTVSWMVPVSELVIALLLVLLPSKRVPLYASFGIMALFTVYIVAIRWFSDYIPCSCGGILEKMSWTQHLVFNLIFLLLAGIGVWLYEPAQAKPSKT